MRIILGLVCLTLAACGESTPCETTALPSRQRLNCPSEFAAQAAQPADTSVPGALTIKTIIDQTDADAVHFLDTTTYPFHQAFAEAHLQFLGTSFVEQYFSPTRLYLLGSITHYEEPDVWAYELAPYDTASAEMIARAYRLLRDASYFGDQLAFHPTSEEQATVAAGLPDDVQVVTTEQIFAGITYQPLNLGETIGQVRIVTVEELETGYVSPREIAVLDRVPNDISVVAGVVTEQFQIPLSHVNVLSQQRGTPNMAVKGAHEAFAPYAGQWVRLEVAAFGYTITPATQAEADAWFEAHRPDPVDVPALDLSRTDLADVDELGLEQLGSYGGKACGFGLLRDIEGIAVRDGFAIPFYYYDQFMKENGFDVEIMALLEDPQFTGDGTYRRAKLLELQGRMEVAPVNPDFVALLDEKLAAEYPNYRMRYRSSTNAEDLDGQIGAGLYESKSGDPDDPEDPVYDAIRKVWASMWNFRAFEEREYLRIPHFSVGMAMLVHESYVAEAANGVAVTANIFDPAAGGEDAFYVNVQLGDGSVTRPDPGVVADQILYFYFHPGQPATYLAHSNLVPEGTTVMSRAELFDLGQQLEKIRSALLRFYDPPDGFGALPLEVDFKLVLDADGTRHVEVKQARPYPGR